MGDRAYGTADLIQWCQRQCWEYRLRLKGNINVYQGIKPTRASSLKPGHYPNVPITYKGIHTNLGVIHEPGHKEAWIIAMSVPSNDYKTLDYGMRWGIEAMFSDFKTRGFSLESTQMKLKDHLDRLILMVSIALYWAVSTGCWVSLNESKLLQKKHPSKKCPKIRAVSFYQGLTLSHLCDC
jgi:DDE family transposase